MQLPNQINLLLLVLSNAFMYFICQAIASICLSAVISQFPYQLESLIPLRFKKNKTESLEKTIISSSVTTGSTDFTAAMNSVAV